MIALQVAIWYVVLSGGGWVYDDNLIMLMARRSGLGWSWLTGLIFEHWGIAYHLVFSGLQSVMPVDYRWGLLAMLGLLGGATYLLQRTISILFASEWLGLAVAAWFGISVLFVRGLQWPAGGFQYLPNAFFDVLCLYAYVRYQADGRRRWVPVASLALAGGLLFYEKPAYMLLYLALLRILFLSPELRARPVLQALWRERAMWASLVAVVLAWAIGFLASGGGAGVAAGHVGAGQYADYFRILWAQALVPAAAGLTLPAQSLSAAQIVVLGVLQVVVVAIVLGSLLRKRTAWRAWLFLLINVLVTGALVARARVATFGVGIGGDLRYLLDFAWLIPLTVCFAFTRSHSLPTPGVAGEQLRVAGGRSWPYVAGALALAAYFAAAIATNVKLEREWPGGQARSWEGRVMALERMRPRPQVADALVPPYVVASAFAPYDRLSWVLRLYAPRVQVDGVLHGRLNVLDDHGLPHPALLSTDGVLAGPVGRGCIGAGSAAAGATGRVVRLVRGAGGPYSLLITYSSPQDASLAVYVDSGHGFPPFTDHFLALARGMHRSILLLDPPPPRSLRFAIPAHVRLCVRGARIVSLRGVS